jgi:hypothetical protein
MTNDGERRLGGLANSKEELKVRIYLETTLFNQPLFR